MSNNYYQDPQQSVSGDLYIEKPPKTIQEKHLLFVGCVLLLASGTRLSVSGWHAVRNPSRKSGRVS